VVWWAPSGDASDESGDGGVRLKVCGLLKPRYHARLENENKFWKIEVAAMSFSILRIIENAQAETHVM